jgi:hypothetical protein
MRTSDYGKPPNDDQDRQEVERRARWRVIRLYVPILAQVLTVLISFIALLIVATQAWIYHQQLKVMSGQLNSMQEAQTEMRAQTEIMKKSFFMNRASVGIASPIANLKAGQITIVLENVGRLPADKIQVEFRESRRIADRTSHGSMQPLNPGQQLIPGGKLPIVVQLDGFDPKEVDNIAAKIEKLYISGVITYDDGFGNSTKTVFGFEYIPKPNEAWTPRAELIKNN